MPSSNLPRGLFTRCVNEYHRLVAIARERGIRVHDYSNRRVPTSVALERCVTLAARLNVPLSFSVPHITGVVPPRMPTQTIDQAITDAVRAATRPTRTSLPPLRAMDVNEFSFGVELEFLIPAHITQGQLAAAIVDAGVDCRGEVYNHFRRTWWKIVTDGSVRARPGFSPWEIVSPVLQGEQGLQQMAKVCDTLGRLGGTINQTCGFHVHIGVTNEMRRPEFFKNLVGHYCANENYIDAIMAPSRRGSVNHYCQPIGPALKNRIDGAASVQDIMTILSPGGRPNRWFKLNLVAFARHGTVEFRHHQGTLEKTKAVSWVKFCMHLVAHATKPEPAINSGNLLDFLMTLKLPAEEVGYFCNRYAHFYSGADSLT